MFLKWFKKLFRIKRKSFTNYVPTFKSLKERNLYIKSLDEITKTSEMTYRGCYGGGCPAPEAIVIPSFLSLICDAF
jgi:hypothetical protein